MNRTHIHFALGLPSNRQVISGMRADCEVVIYIDMKAALQGKYYSRRNNNWRGRLRRRCSQLL